MNIHRVRGLLRELAPVRKTALAVHPERRVPSPSAFARFGDGSWILPPTRVEGADRIEIGDGVVVLEGSALLCASGARLTIGDGARLAKGVEVVCTVGVTIGAGVSTADQVGITDSWATLVAPPGTPPPPAAAVVIEDGAYLGWGSVVGPGVRVGRGAFVGEGAIVLRDVAPHSVVYGNPACPVPGHAARAGR